MFQDAQYTLEKNGAWRIIISTRSVARNCGTGENFSPSSTTNMDTSTPIRLGVQVRFHITVVTSTVDDDVQDSAMPERRRTPAWW